MNQNTFVLKNLKFNPYATFWCESYAQFYKCSTWNTSQHQGSSYYTGWGDCGHSRQSKRSPIGRKNNQMDFFIIIVAVIYWNLRTVLPKSTSMSTSSPLEETNYSEQLLGPLPSSFCSVRLCFPASSANLLTADKEGHTISKASVFCALHQWCRDTSWGRSVISRV